MNQAEISALLRGIAPAIGDLVARSMQPLANRIAELEQQIADMPAPKDGRDGVDGKDGSNGLDGAPGAPGQDGKDAEPVTAEQIAEAVAQYLAINPPVPGRDGLDGANGKDGAPGPSGKDGASGLDGKDGAPGRDGVDGKDGVGLAGAVQSKDGHLVLTLTSGATVDVGQIGGRDGRDGQKGADGADGRDGLGFDDLSLVEGELGVSLRFAQGEVAKEFPLPIVFDRGVFREGGAYVKGNGVTWGGSYWIAQKDDPGKPDTPDGGWRLAVKKGQNGKDLTK